MVEDDAISNEYNKSSSTVMLRVYAKLFHVTEFCAVLVWLLEVQVIQRMVCGGSNATVVANCKNRIFFSTAQPAL